MSAEPTRGSTPGRLTTFVLTDIEGSTPMWEQAPDVAGPAIARHYEIVAAVVAAHGGRLVREKGEGDSAFAVFDSAVAAVTAAAGLQRALAVEPWPDGAAIRVRIGVHTGEAALRDGDYFGAPVNRCARLRGIAHGGQAVISAATYEVVRDHLPDPLTLLDLGEHRLRDLMRPERVFQLCHPDLPRAFPALRSLSGLPTNLPMQLTSFIGRERQMEAVDALLDTSRLVTLTGSGGAGKTRLALELSVNRVDLYSGGAWFVDLSPSGPERVVPEIARALGLREEGAGLLQDRLLDYLREHEVLLVLDNCEHVIAETSQLVQAALERTEGTRFLCTSRERLRIAGEVTYPVPPLGVPAPGEVAAADRLSQYESVRLFIDRALVADPGFAVADDNAPAVAGICHRLDGIPLAIELAAARLRILDVAEVDRRLADRFTFLVATERAEAPRRQTLRALVAWSHDLLEEEEKSLWRRLSVFAGGFTLAAAETVCADEMLPADAVLDLLAALVDKSVVTRQAGDASRFHLLETIREFGDEQLSAAGEGAALRVRHLDWITGLVVAEAERMGGPAIVDALEAVDIELPNIRQALDFALVRGAAPEQGARLASAMAPFWETRGLWGEGLSWLAVAGDLAESVAPSVRWDVLQASEKLHALRGELDRAAEVARRAVDLAVDMGDRKREGRARLNLGAAAARRQRYDDAAPEYERARELAEETGDEPGRAQALHSLGTMLSEVDQPDRAAELLEEALAIRRRLGRVGEVHHSLHNLGYLAHGRHDWQRATNFLQEAATIRRALKDPANLGHALNMLGVLETQRARYGEARAFLTEAADLARGVGDPVGLARSITNLATLAYSAGEHGTAQEMHREALHLFRRVGDRDSEAQSLYNLASVASGLGDGEGALQLMQDVLQIRREIGPPSDVARTTLGLARIFFNMGRLLDSKRLAQDAVEEFRRLGDPLRVADALNLLAQTHRGLNDVSSARAAATEGLAVARELDSPFLETVLSGRLADIEAAEGQIEAALSLYDLVAGLQEERQEFFSLGMTLAARGGCLLKAGRFEAAAADFENVSQLGRKTGIPHLLFDGGIQLTSLHLAQGHLDDAEACLAAVSKLVDGSGNAAWKPVCLLLRAELRRQRGDAEGALVDLAESIASANRSEQTELAAEAGTLAVMAALAAGMGGAAIAHARACLAWSATGTGLQQLPHIEVSALVVSAAGQAVEGHELMAACQGWRAARGLPLAPSEAASYTGLLGAELPQGSAPAELGALHTRAGELLASLG
ncbi:MAG: tetratricopeptide repeat protein [Candidatus Dormibacteria bacterium]